MTPLVFIALAFAGGAGAAVRFWLDGVISARVKKPFPYATAVINVSGSFALGALTGAAGALVVPESIALIIGTGFLGGYTTFSTASVETVRLIQQGRWLAGVVNGVGMLLLAVAAAAFGWWLIALL
ncbi:fluoride efflux transporter CrcB [Paramicrobacterium agarici]|uniref:Fluoride-specific ion channel FluC n=1 Tax=Paramicrobacterium agarici TaxID=630514 RepID=A0A2A9DRQ4_9MICO|nr:fluoride efflux transporter CrcB [Microbacterium agarici]PFG29273.1 camphor resistance protein CrcB [Microbacterium agarici]TQO22222.1 camphor resistance protein CrcB [Microbacterium agarici]